jgi:hypothetical protein
LSKVNYIQDSFTTGEISPLLAGQIRLQKYASALESAENLLIRAHGPITRRPGTYFVAEVKTSSKKTRTIKFEFSSTQAYNLEFGDQYIRFYKDRGQIYDGPIPYEISTPYLEAHLPDLWLIQSADTMYITHPSYLPRKLTRTGHTNWTLSVIEFKDGPYLSQNLSDTTLTPSADNGTITIKATPAVGSEKVTNGVFASTSGPEIVTDGDFAVAGPWVYGGTWAHDAVNLEADHGAGDATPLSQTLAIAAAKTYTVAYTIKNMTGGTLTPSLGGVAGITRSLNGTYTELITTTGIGDLLFTPDAAAFDGSVDDVSVKEAIADTAWTWGAGWSHDLANLEADHTPGSIAALEQNIGVTSGKDYYIVFTVKNRTAGSVTPWIGAASGAAVIANGTYQQAITSVNTGNLQFIPSTDFDGSIDDVSVKEASSTVDVFQVGHVGSYWRLKHGDTWGYVKITVYTSRIQVTAEVQISVDTEGGVHTGTTTASGWTEGTAHKIQTNRATLGGTAATKIWREGAWSDVRGYPACCCFHEERLIFAGTTHQPQTLWGSGSGDFENFTPENTITNSGPITYTLASNDVNIIKWLASSRVLMIGTMSGEWKVSASSINAPITPTDIAVRQDTSYGSAGIRPQTIGDVTLFVQRRGRKVRELVYAYEKDAYVAPDMAIMAEHISKGGIIETAYQKDPDQVLWCVRGDGVLLAMTYERAQEVIGWTRIVTDGLFESVAVIPGINQDEIWVVVKRTIGGVTKRYVEYFTDLDWGSNVEDCFFVDSGLSYSGVPVSSVSGLSHLEGKEVDILTDGAAHARKTVSGGAVTLDLPASKVHVGLPYTSKGRTLKPEAGSAQGTSQGEIKRIHKLILRLYQTLGMKVGPSLDKLETLPFRSPSDPMDAPPPLFTGDKEVSYQGGYDKHGQIWFVQDQPLPMTLCALIYHMTVMEG